MQNLCKTTLKVFVGISVVGLYSCNKGKDPVKQSDAEQDTVVYVAGYEKNASNSANAAIYWKNGVPVRLTNSIYNAGARSIFVVGKDIYVAGFIQNSTGNTAAVYWKNGKVVELTDGTTECVANSIFVSGTDIYVAGYQSKKLVHVATYWKNDKAFELTDGSVRSNANAIYVTGNDVYVAGSNIPILEDKTNMTDQATYWKNGVAIQLADSSSPGSGANSITVSGQDVYIAGYETKFRSTGVYLPVAQYWKNGQALPLTDGFFEAKALSISISNNDVYVSGYEAGPLQYLDYVQIKTWKNGKVISTNATNIPFPSPEFIGMHVLGSTVYVAGSIDYGPCTSPVLLKDGKETKLNEITKCGVATSVFVIP